MYINLIVHIHIILNEASELLSVNVGDRQGCVISPLMLNLYIYGVVREVHARTLGRGTQLVGDGEEKWNVSQLFHEEFGEVGGKVWEGI